MNIDKLVDRFLRWPLPESVASDPCATTQGFPNRIGTNLLTATEAKQMLEFVMQEIESDAPVDGFLPCPFCGSNEISEETEYDNCHTSGIYIECTDCGNRTAAWSQLEIAKQYWNERLR